MSLYKVDGTIFSDDRMMRFERGGIESNGALSNTFSATTFRSEMCYRCDGKKVRIVFKTSGTITSAKAVFYSESGSLVSSATLTISNSIAEASVPSGAKIFKVEIVLSSVADLIGFCPNEAVCNPNIINSAIGTSAAFVYRVSEGAYTSGRLLLPPNYSMDGKPVPMVVYVHGSGGMTSWDSVLGYGVDFDYRPYLQYLANEGFAVFDCFPWTDKETITTPLYSPFSVPVILKSYIEGIRYVCSRFNVDIDKVNLLCKSQGGEFGHWACIQTVFKFSTISLFAPATMSGMLSGSGNSGGMFYNTNSREAITKYSDFDGTSSELSTFISNGNFENATVKSFCDKNKGKIVSLMPYALGVANSTLDELYSLLFAQTSSVPQWMLDEGVPDRPSSSIPVYSIAEHEDFVKLSSTPIRFWGAFDDTAVSMYSNYAICRWLQNSGADATFRTLPLNTGGHHAMDSASSALKSSGTTALGIAYTNMPTAYVEVVDFIRLKCGD